MTEFANLTALLEAIQLSEETKQKLTDAKTALTAAIEANNEEDTTAATAVVEEHTTQWEEHKKEEELLRVTARQFLTKKEEPPIALETENKDVVELIEQPRSVPTAVSAMKTSFNFKLPKPEKFVRGQNFPKFCTKFMDYVTLSNISGDNLHILFLNLVDEFTAEKLRKVPLSTEQKRFAQMFTTEYIKKINPSHEGRTYRTKLADLRQDSKECIEDFAYRLSDTASRAFADTPSERLLREEACFSAFLKGLIDPEIRMKLHEFKSITTFEDAMDEACRLESIRATAGPKATDLNTEELEVMKVNDATNNTNAGLSSNSGRSRDYYRSEDRADRQQNHSRTRRSDSSWNRQSDYYDRDRRQDSYSRDRRQDNYSRDRRQDSYSRDRQREPHKDSRNTTADARDNTPRQHASHSLQGSKRNGPIICYRCHQPNHVARNCTVPLNE